MTQLDIHPEHLIDRVLRGLASETERSELSAHIRVCQACAVERQLAEALRERLSSEDETTSAAVDAALATLVSAGRLAPAPPSTSRNAPHSARAWMPWAAAACLFFAGSAAAATLIMAVRGSSPSPAVSQAPGRSSARPASARKKRTEPSRPPAVLEVAEAGGSQPEPPAIPPVRARRVQAALPTSPLVAAELFAKARAAAMQGDFAEAAGLYATLQKRFATSPQAHVSHVVLGRLYLEHLSDPSAALAQFDAYLQKGGPNRPEALLGRAHTLRALGRVQDEVETLRNLVDAYPESLYVAPAEQRLRAMQR